MSTGLMWDANGTLFRTIKRVFRILCALHIMVMVVHALTVCAAVPGFASNNPYGIIMLDRLVIKQEEVARARPGEKPAV